MSAKLKPCPFCGRSRYLSIEDAGSIGRYVNDEPDGSIPTRLPEFVPDRAAILYGLRKFGIDAPQSVGIKRETIRELLDGSTTRPTASLMMQLARLFECGVEDLMSEA